MALEEKTAIVFVLKLAESFIPVDVWASHYNNSTFGDRFHNNLFATSKILNFRERAISGTLTKVKPVKNNLGSAGK